MKKPLGFDLILLGDSTSGKDTQSLLLAKKYNVKLARSGKYLRKFWPKQYVQGGVAPSNLLVFFINQALKHLGNKNIVFVGAARLRPEAQYLVKQLKKRNRHFFTIYLKLPKKEIIKRSNSRAQRLEDIDINLINSRVAYYKTEVSKTAKFYQKLGKLKYINGNQSIKLVSRDIQKVINDYKKSRRN